MTGKELDYLEKQTNAVLRKLNQILAERDDDGDEQEDNSNYHLSDAHDALADDADADPDESEPDADEDDVEGEFGKAGSLTYTQTENNPNTRPGARSSTTHYSPGLTLTPATRTADRHKFDSRVEFVADRDGVTKQTAMSRARLEFPDDYASYQEFNASTPTSEPYARRGGWGNNIGKSAPTFDSLIGSEMRKGVTEEIAKQRIINRYGNTALRDNHFAKRVSDDTAVSFTDAAEDLWTDSNLSRCEALRETRKAHPALYKRLVD